jgi:hypothetical protein
MLASWIELRLKFSKITISISHRAFLDCRQTTSALIVLKSVFGPAITTIAISTHRYFESMLTQDHLIIIRTILAAANRLVDALLRRLLKRKCSVQTAQRNREQSLSAADEINRRNKSACVIKAQRTDY